MYELKPNIHTYIYISICKRFSIILYIYIYIILMMADDTLILPGSGEMIHPDPRDTDGLDWDDDEKAEQAAVGQSMVNRPRC